MDRIGVDIGGTFTDVVWIDSNGSVRFDKSFSTPGVLYEGVLEGIKYLSSEEDAFEDRLKDVERFAHGTTVSTNALIERKGAKVGLLTTAGFEDTLLIGRATLSRTGGLPINQAMDFTFTQAPSPLVDRSLIRGIDERVTLSGEVLISPTPDRIRQEVLYLLECGIESLAVVFLWSFRNSAHELLVREITNEIAPALPISLSSEIAPHIGEFERMVSTVANAYVAPLSNQYLSELGEHLRLQGFAHTLHVMTATGGSILPSEVDNKAVSLINSGPVGGLIAARYLGEGLGWKNLITADMGGTSFDVGVIVNDKFEIEENPFLAHGLPSKLPAVKIVTIGAGGGSVAWTDGHRLYVGPESAGSDPGPACYSRGGQRPTVTDALVTLGILHPKRFFAGRRELDSEAALNSIKTFIAAPLGLDPYDAADGIYKVVTAKMADLIRKASIEQGNDPRTFNLCAFGGAAGSHAALLMEQLGISSVIIPYAASVFSAMGISLSDILYSAGKAFPLAVEPTESFSFEVAGTFRELISQVEASISASGIEREKFIFSFELDIRYKGQINSVTVQWDRPTLKQDQIPLVKEAFEKVYERRFGVGSTHKSAPLELIGVRLYAISPLVRPELSPVPSPAEWSENETRLVYSKDKGWYPITVVPFNKMPSELELAGPAVIERGDTTIWIPPNFAAVRDRYANVIISCKKDPK